MKWFNNLAEKFDFDKGKVISLIFAIGFTTIIFLDTNYFDHLLLTGAYIVSFSFMAVVLTAIMLVAGFAVYKAVIHASIGFGVMIFLAKTYCDLPNTTPDGMQALTALWTIGLVYIIFEFSNKLQEAYKEHTKKIKGDEKKSWEARTLVVLYLLFVIMYISLILQVLSPIILDLCIYK